MKIGAKGIELLKKFEGCELKAYKCSAGKLTIGYGSTFGVKEGDCITQEEAEARLKRDLKQFEDAINKHVTVPLTQNQFDALVCLVYNIGIGNFVGLPKPSTVLRELNSGNYKAAAEGFLLWNKITKNGQRVVLQGLVNRRKAEKELFLS